MTIPMKMLQKITMHLVKRQNIRVMPFTTSTMLQDIPMEEDSAENWFRVHWQMQEAVFPYWAVVV